MSNILDFRFQKIAVNELTRRFNELWVDKKDSVSDRYILFNAPTGSGKTVMMGMFLERATDISKKVGLENRCFIWVTPRPVLAKQSKESLSKKYNLNCLEISDSPDELKNNQIFFCNWEGIKESANYGNEDEGVEYPTFWKMINKTKENREIILLIDEGHFGAETKITDKIVEKIDPAVIIKFSATLDNTENAVVVNEEDVIEEQLITKEINLQTKDEISKRGIDIDNDADRKQLLLEVARERRESLAKEYSKEKANINPLVLIQLPNNSRGDKGFEKEESKATNDAKQQIFESKYYKSLIKKGVKEENIAIWLSNEKLNLDKGEISKNDNRIEYLFFKTAIATGWDCPRAKVLVIFRDTTAENFRIQTIGRIRRMPEGKHYKNSELNISYVYTEYNRQETDILELTRKSSIKHITLERSHLTYTKIDEIDELKFQEVLKKEFDKKYKTKKDLEKKSVEIKDPRPTISILTGLKAPVVRDFLEQLGDTVNDQIGNLQDKRILMQEEYDEMCKKIITETKDDWILNYSFDKNAGGKLKRAINSWLRSKLSDIDQDKITLIALAELQRGKGDDGPISFTLKKEEGGVESQSEKGRTDWLDIIADSIKEYARVMGDKSKRKESVNEYKDKVQVPLEKLTYFNVGYDKQKKKYTNFIKYDGITNFAYEPCYLKNDITGPERELIDRILTLHTDYIDWWYKQKDFGTSVFGVTYYDTSEKVKRMFYPDFIFKTKSNKLFIVDTKQGDTARSQETVDKAKGLQEYIEKHKEVDGLKLIGGIVVPAGAALMINMNKEYKYDLEEIENKDGGWEDLVGHLD